MGHEDTKLVFTTYSRWLPDHDDRREAKKLEGALVGLAPVMEK
jgi:hypothetical protein